MSKLLTIKQASAVSGLSVMSLRRRVAAGTIPYTRTNLKEGKLLFDEDLLLQALKDEVKASISTQDSTPKPSKLSQLFKLPSDTIDAQTQRDELFGYKSNTNQSSSFTIK